MFSFYRFFFVAVVFCIILRLEANDEKDDSIDIIESLVSMGKLDPQIIEVLKKGLSGKTKFNPEELAKVNPEELVKLLNSLKTLKMPQGAGENIEKHEDLSSESVDELEAESVEEQEAESVEEQEAESVEEQEAESVEQQEAENVEEQEAESIKDSTDASRLEDEL